MLLIPQLPYRVESPSHGAHNCIVVLVSQNQRSVVLKLQDLVALPAKDGGLFLVDFLPLAALTEDTYTDILTGGDWKILPTTPHG